MLAELSAMQSVPFEAEEPDGTYYEYDRNLKATVKVTPAERRELHRMLSGLSALQSVPADAEEPDGTYYEYDRNLKATVKVTPDGERTPVEELERNFEPARRKGSRSIAHEEITT